MPKKYKGLVIGCGLAGYTRPEGNHVDCYQKHQRCELIGIIDKDRKKANRVARKLGCRNYVNIDEALKDDPDVVSLAVHPPHRSKYFKKICQRKSVRVIFCEKPLSYTSKEALQIVKLCKKHNKLLYINNQRRANKTYQQLKMEFLKGKRGPLLSAIFYYMRGMWANASHYADLSLMLFGKPQWVFAQKSTISSPYSNDPNVTMLLGYKNFQVHFIPQPSWEKGYYSGDHMFIFDKESLFVPNPSFYKSSDVVRKVAKNRLLQNVKPDLLLHRDTNDYIPMLDFIVSDLEKKAKRESLDPMDAVWSVKILECAQKSCHQAELIRIN